MNNRPVFVIGNPGSGKDTLANNIVKFRGYKKLSFAEPLYNVVEKFLGRKVDKATERDLLVFTGELMKYRPAPLPVFFDENPHSVRRYIKEICELSNRELFFGNNSFTDDFWVHILYEYITGSDKPVVISDMRFLEEYNGIKHLNPFIVRLNITKENAEKRLTERDGGFNPNIWNSRSENEWRSIPFDLAIDVNDLTAEEVFEEFGLFYEKV